MLTKVTRAAWVRGHRLLLSFSDGTEGEYDFAWVKESDGEMAQPLKAVPYFRRFFVQDGVLCWPNGFDMDGHSLQAYIQEGDGLRWSAARRRASGGGLRESAARYRTTRRKAKAKR